MRAKPSTGAALPRHRSVLRLGMHILAARGLRGIDDLKPPYNDCALSNNAFDQETSSVHCRVYTTLVDCPVPRVRLHLDIVSSTLGERKRERERERERKRETETYRKLQKFPFSKIPKIINLENSNNFEFGKFKKLSIWIIPKCRICRIPKT